MYYIGKDKNAEFDAMEEDTYGPRGPFASAAAAPSEPMPIVARPRRRRRLEDDRGDVWADEVREAADQDLVPEENKGFSCSVCAKFGGGETMLVCDSLTCDNAVHLECMMGGFAAVPFHQFHCDKCCARFRCSKCELGSSNQRDWISCSQCGQQAHVACFDAGTFESVSSDWICPDCHCQICHSADVSDAYACHECTKCFHETCNASMTIDGDAHCPSCAATKLLTMEAEAPLLDDANVDGDEADDGLQDLFDMSLALSSQSLSSEPEFLHALRALADLRPSPKRRLLLIALEVYIDGHHLAASTVRSILGAAAEQWNINDLDMLGLCAALPPLNLNRVLSRLCPLSVTETTLSVTIDQLIFSAVLAMRDPGNLFVQLYCSSTNVHSVPLYAPGFAPCNAVIGSRMKLLHAELDKRFPDDRAQNIVPVLFSWSNDETSSSYAATNPVIIWLQTMDYHGVVLNMQTAVAELGFLPTLAAIQCTNQSHENVPLSQCGSLLKTALNELSLKFIRFMFDKINKMGDNGVVRFTHNGEPCAIRPILCSLVFDLEEQRRFFDAPTCSWWSCVLCHNVNRGLDFSAVSALDLDLSKKTMASDGELRAFLNHALGDPTFGDDDGVTKLATRLGIKLSKTSRSVLLLAKNEPALPFIGEPADLAAFDVLHGAQGAMKKVFDCFSETVCNTQWLRLCSALGDKTYTSPAVVSFLRFEDYMQDWFFLVVALLVVDDPLRVKFAKKAADVNVSTLRDLATSLLFVCYACKDESPGDVIDEIDQACALLGTSYKAMITGVRKVKAEASYTGAVDTLKIHLLSQHVPTAIRAFGCLKQQSTLLMESRHAQTKQDKSIGGAHISYAPKALLYKGFWRAVKADLNANVLLQVKRNTPFTPVDRREIHALRDRHTVWDTVRRNFEAVALRMDELPALDIAAVQRDMERLDLGADPVWGNALECWTECATRRTKITSSVVCQVPFTSRARSAGRLLAVSFKPHASAEYVSPCGNEACVAHNPATELFPPLSRLRTSKVGIPLLFLKSSKFERKQFALLLVLQSAPWSRNAIVPRFSLQYGAQWVPLAHVRDWHWMAYHEHFIYQCLAGSRAFGHLA